MKTILVGYDGEETSERALRRAAEYAKAFGSAVHVTSVAPVLVGGPRGMGPYDPTDPPSEHVKQLEHAKAYLAEQGVTTAGVEPAIGDAADAILEVADQVGADLIVLGSHERSLVEHALGMSVSGTVSRKAHRDVLIVH
jgi:nucleotide-binding universal stress UspA family protein